MIIGCLFANTKLAVYMLYSQISSDHDRPQLADPREEYKYFEEVKSTKCKLKDKQHYLTPEEIQHLEDLGLLGDYS